MKCVESRQGAVESWPPYRFLLYELYRFRQLISSCYLSWTNMEIALPKTEVRVKLAEGVKGPTQLHGYSKSPFFSPSIFPLAHLSSATFHSLKGVSPLSKRSVIQSNPKARSSHLGCDQMTPRRFLNPEASGWGADVLDHRQTRNIGVLLPGQKSMKELMSPPACKGHWGVGAPTVLSQQPAHTQPRCPAMGTSVAVPQLHRTCNHKSGHPASLWPPDAHSTLGTQAQRPL